MAAGGSVRCLEEHQETLDNAKSWVASYQTGAGVEVELWVLWDVNPGNSDTLSCACHLS